MAPRRKLRPSPEDRAKRAIERMSAGTIAGRVESASPARRFPDPRIFQRGSGPCPCPVGVRTCGGVEVGRPGARLHHDTDQTVFYNHTSETLLNWAIEDYDDSGFHTAVTKLEILANGTFRIFADVPTPSGSEFDGDNVYSHCYLRLNGTTNIAEDFQLMGTGAINTHPEITDTFTDGDYIEVMVWQNSGFNVEYTGSTRFFQIDTAIEGTCGLLVTDDVLRVDATNGDIVVPLPPAASAVGKFYYVKRTDSSANAVTLDPDGSETIDGETTWPLAPLDSVELVSDGTEWSVLDPAAGGSITVAEQDGTPTVSDVTTIKVTNGKLTDDGGGVVSLDLGGGGLAVVAKTADETVTSSTTLQDDDHLQFAIAANETWVARWVLYVDGATGGDIKATVVAPSGATGTVSVLGPGTAATTFENATIDNQAASLGGAPPAGLLGSGNVIVVYVEAVIFNSSTAGTVKLQWAQQTSSGTATKVYKGSFMVANMIGGTGGGGGGAPTGADYLVGTADATLTNEIVVGATPGGELGGTWAAPTVDATHSGSAHHAQDHASRHAADGADPYTGKYKAGAGAVISDADYSSTPPNGTIAVAHDTTTGKSYLYARANGAWRSVELT